MNQKQEKYIEQLEYQLRHINLKYDIVQQKLDVLANQVNELLSKVNTDEPNDKE